jgi:hypothetical protein
MNDFFNQRVSSVLAILLIMVLSFAVALYSLSAGKRAVADFSRIEMQNSIGK